ncbi:hypothetical protein Goklo_013708 [Gossypium klotzschianum]|uniref:Reverse transcriptase n=1 Tax=Gossypium klotzschianum TaxID=34286 RepID=A0A7J8U5D2_9ROSI|nr:hypothetical protein [Gossypium klotzschianum]
MGHGVKECSKIPIAECEKIDNEYSYSLALKVESNLIGKESFQFGFSAKRIMKQCLYTGVATIDREEIMPKNLPKSKHQEGEQIGLEKEVEVLIFELKSMGQGELSPYADVDNLNRGSHSNGMGRSPALPIGKPTGSNESLKLECSQLGGIPKETRGGLCLAWNEGISIVLRSYSKNHVDVIVKEEADSPEWRLIGFYGAPNIREKEAIWNLLKRLGRDQSFLWMVCKDFNEIMYMHEKKGGILRDERRMEDFHNTLADCSLIDLGFLGA